MRSSLRTIDSEKSGHFSLKANLLNENGRWSKFATIALLTLSTTTGCTICSPGYIDDYATVGGKWQRTDPVDGRVGSPFSDSGTALGGPQEITLGAHAMPYDGEIIDEGVEVEVLGTENSDDEIYYEDGIEVVPQYENLGIDW